MSTTDREQQAREHLEQCGAISTGPDGDDNIAMLLAFLDSSGGQRLAGLDTTDLVDRLRKGKLIAPATTVILDGREVSTGETRELAHPDALEAADVIERLTNELRDSSAAA